jgi:hypothetical protein
MEINLLNCEFKEKCTSRGKKCLNCKHNKSVTKEDHYLPMENSGATGITTGPQLPRMKMPKTFGEGL